jgi:hypothetical protein
MRDINPPPRLGEVTALADDTTVPAPDGQPTSTPAAWAEGLARCQVWQSRTIANQYGYQQAIQLDGQVQHRDQQREDVVQGLLAADGRHERVDPGNVDPDDRQGSEGGAEAAPGFLGLYLVALERQLGVAVLLVGLAAPLALRIDPPDAPLPVVLRRPCHAALLPRASDRPSRNQDPGLAGAGQGSGPRRVARKGQRRLGIAAKSASSS